MTEDEVMRLLERADPARGVTPDPAVDAAGYLDALRTRNTTVTLIDTEPDRPEPEHRHRWPIITVVAAAVVAIVVGGLVLAPRDPRLEPTPRRARRPRARRQPFPRPPSRRLRLR